MTLTEFLLARIAEDEERLVHDFDCERFNVRDYGSRQGDCDCDATDRLLADCKAKRQIVGSCHADYEYAQGRGDDTTEVAEEVMWHLALPYADHSDYREEWKP